MAVLNWPNRITLTRILLIAPLVICLLNLGDGGAMWRRLALLLFLAMAASDAIDGFLARRFGEETALGRFLDPVGDKLLIVCTIIILAVPATAVAGYRLPTWVVVIAVGKDLLTVIGFLLVYVVTGRWLVQARAWGKSCTLVQLAMVAFTLAAPDLPAVLAQGVPVLWWLASGLAVLTVADYVRLGSRFAAEAPPGPAREQRP